MAKRSRRKAKALRAANRTLPSKVSSFDSAAGFVAYPSQDQAQAAMLENAIITANADHHLGLRLTSWRRNQPRTSRIISNILEQITSSEYFIADLSGANESVLFELGYAFGKRKRLICLIQGHSDQIKAHDLSTIGMLSTLNIASVQNRDDILDTLRSYGPSGQHRRPEFDVYTVPPAAPPTNALLLKGSTNHDIAGAVTSTLLNAFPNAFVDDWTEDPAQSLTWYLKATLQSRMVIGLFVSPSWNDAAAVNSRFAFVCGLAVALGRHVRVLAMPGYHPAFDYRDIVTRVNDATAATRVVEQAFANVTSTSRSTEQELLPPRPPARTEGASVRDDDQSVVLLDIAMGEIGNTLAEHEEDDLGDYFVPTAQFTEALRGSHSVFVGPKGSGKTANFLRLIAELGQDRRNVVCYVKPEDYKMGRFLAALGRITDTYGAQVHVSQTAWKLVLISALVATMKERSDRFEATGSGSQADKELALFFERHVDLISAPLEAKLDLLAKWLEESAFEQVHFTERVHRAFISEALVTLAPHVRRAERVIFLLDNLDRAWDRGQNLELQAQVMFALMGLDRELAGDFGDARVHATLFLRRNIFEYILRDVRERDKLLGQTAELVWSDAALLGRVIRERVRVACIRQGVAQAEVWGDIFPREVEGTPTEKWLYDHIMPRPRDLIHLIRKAMETAVNREHKSVYEADLIDAVRSYSAFAVNQVISEYESEEPWIAQTIFALAGRSVTMDIAEAETLFRGLALESHPSARDMAVRLVEAGFLGVCLDGPEARYAVTADDGLLLSGRVAAHPDGEPLRLTVYPAFRPYLSLAGA